MRGPASCGHSSGNLGRAEILSATRRGSISLEFCVCLRTEARCLVALGSVPSARGDGLGRHCCRPQRPLAYGSRRLLSCAVGGAVAFPPIPPPSVRTYVLLRIDRASCARRNPARAPRP